VIDVKVGVNLTSVNAPIRVVASGLKPGSVVLAIVQSTPRVFDRATVQANGSVSKTFWLPSDLEPGAHRVIIRVVDAAGKTLNFEAPFTLSESGTLLKKAATASLMPTTLPETGSNAPSLWVLALILLAVGGSVLVRRRVGVQESHF
jgi:LPXTG-motif cell wall-anchored protein